jgi:hypothetical protein
MAENAKRDPTETPDDTADPDEYADETPSTGDAKPNDNPPESVFAPTAGAAAFDAEASFMGQ